MSLSHAQIKEAIAVLRAGGVIVFPTESSYALGCDATNKKAVAKIFAIKGRPDGKGMPLLVDSLARAKQYAQMQEETLTLAKEHWPGALTLVLPRKKGGKKVVSACLENRQIALRISSHPIARALAKGLGRPLVATSANRSGALPAFSVHAAAHLSADLFLNAGALPKRRPSTLVCFDKEQMIILRKGQLRL